MAHWRASWTSTFRTRGLRAVRCRRGAGRSITWEIASMADRMASTISSAIGRRARHAGRRRRLQGAPNANGEVELGYGVLWSSSARATRRGGAGVARAGVRRSVDPDRCWADLASLTLDQGPGKGRICLAGAGADDGAPEGEQVIRYELDREAYRTPHRNRVIRSEETAHRTAAPTTAATCSSPPLVPPAMGGSSDLTSLHRSGAANRPIDS